MKTTFTTFAALIAATFIAQTPAQAQEVSIEPYGNPVHTELIAADDGTMRVVVTAKRQTSRESVLAQLAQYIAAGSPGSETGWSGGDFVSTMSRAEVHAQLMQAKADGSFDASGEASHTSFAQPQRSAAVQQAIRVAAVR